MLNIMFVCLGNICRSPTAHGIFEAKVKARGLADYIQVFSSGTGDWHIGNSPDQRMTDAAKTRGFDLSYLRAENINANSPFTKYDYIFAMDKQNLADLQAMLPSDYNGELALFLSVDPAAQLAEVPDPYYGGEAGFYHVLDLVEQACDALLDKLIEKYQLPA